MKEGKMRTIWIAALIAVAMLTNAATSCRVNAEESKVAKLLYLAVEPCKRAVESRAKHLRWTEPGKYRYFNDDIGKFSSSVFQNVYHQKKRLIGLYGDEAVAKNDLGNYVQVSYTCMFDLQSNTVLDVAVEFGKTSDVMLEKMQDRFFFTMTQEERQKLTPIPPYGLGRKKGQDGCVSEQGCIEEWSKDCDEACRDRYGREVSDSCNASAECRRDRREWQFENCVKLYQSTRQYAERSKAEAKCLEGR
jgi:hypothetical protein